MLTLENHIGKITVSELYVKQLTEQTVLQSFGVAGFSQPSLTEILTGGRRSPVTILTKDGKLIISIHVKVVYGVNIPAVVRALMHKVEFAVEDALQLPVSHVRVYVDEVVEP